MGIANCGDVHVLLQGGHIVQLDSATQLTGTQYRGEFEERLKGVIGEVFVSERNAANIAKPALSRGDLQVIGATAVEVYTDIDGNTRRLCEEVFRNEFAVGRHVERFLGFAVRVGKPPPPGAAVHSRPDTGAGIPDVCRMEGSIVEEASAVGLLLAGRLIHPRCRSTSTRS